jgi:hypothetical protein
VKEISRKGAKFAKEGLRGAGFRMQVKVARILWIDLFFPRQRRGRVQEDRVVLRG